MRLVTQLDSFALQLLQYFTPAISIYRSEHSLVVFESRGKGKKYKIKSYQSYSLKEDSYWQNIKNDFSFKNKLIVTNLYSSTGLFKLVEIPKMEEVEIENWLLENISEILPIPNILNQSSLYWRLIETKNDPMTGLVAAINQDELTKIREEFELNEIPLHGVVFKELAFFEKAGKEKLQLNYYKSGDSGALILADSHGLVYYSPVPPEMKDINLQSAWNWLEQLDTSESTILEMIREKSPDIKYANIDLTSKEESVLAQQLACSAYIHPSATFDLLPDKLKIIRDETIWGNLLKRFALVAGSFIAGLLIIIIIANLTLSLLINNISDNLQSMHPQLVEIDSLTAKKNNLQQTFTETQKLFATRSKSFLIMSAIAVHIPKDVWLTEINYNVLSDDLNNLFLIGYSRQREAINSFLSNMEADDNFKNVKLAYLKKLSSGDFRKSWKISSSKYNEFKITMDF